MIESAKTPSGATQSAHCTTIIIASETPSKKFNTTVRRISFTRATAMPKKSANTASGSSAPSAAALKGFFGTMLSKKLPSAGASGAAVVALPRRAAAASDETGQSFSISGVSRADTTAAPVRNARNVRMARAVSPPVAAVLVAEAMPVMRSDTINGITVICRRLSQSSPSGLIVSAASRSIALSTASIATPAMRPAMSAAMMAMLCDM